MAKQLEGARAEREKLTVAERVLNRLTEQEQAAAEAAAPAPARVAGRTVLLESHCSESSSEAALLGDYREILAIVRAVDGPVQGRVSARSLI